MAVDATSENREANINRRTDFERGVYGEKVIERLPLDCLVTLSQVREAKNRAATELKATIANRLINQIDVARMAPDAFFDYISFVNEIWGVENDPAAAQLFDGKYYLVIAGHTRVQTIREIESERPFDMPTDYPEGPLLDCKVYDAMTPRDIISLQLDENIYQSPAQERRAMAIVETYLFGLRHNLWKNKAEFLREDGTKFGRKVLDDAMHFIELPAQIRDFVLVGGKDALPYIAGVELGKTIGDRRKRDLTMYFGARPVEALREEELNELQEGLMDWLGYEVSKLQDRDRVTGKKLLGSTALIKGRYENLRNQYMAVLPAETIEGQPAQQVLDTMVDPIAEYRLERRRLRERHAARVRNFAEKPLDQMAELLYLHFDLLGRDEDTIVQLPEILQREYMSKVGKRFIEVSQEIELEPQDQMTL